MSKNCVGLDIGSSSVKMVQVKVTSKGTRLLNFGIEPLPSQTIVDGAIMNQGAVVDAIRSLRTALGLREKTAAVAVSGHSVIIKKIKMPIMAQADLDEQIPWEAEQHIPFSKDDVEMDHQVVVADDGEGKMDVILVAAKKEVVEDYSSVVREAKMSPVVMDVAAFTVQNAFESAYEVPDGAIALINIGATLSNINVLIDGISAFTRDVTSGGNRFTEELQKRLNIGEDEAEAFKVGTPMESAKDIVPQEVNAVLADVADEMAGAFQRSLDFFWAHKRASCFPRLCFVGAPHGCWLCKEAWRRNLVRLLN